jgi:hypothetical protein
MSNESSMVVLARKRSAWPEVNRLHGAASSRTEHGMERSARAKQGPGEGLRDGPFTVSAPTGGNQHRLSELVTEGVTIYDVDPANPRRR